MDHIAILLFRILGEVLLSGMCIFIGTSTARQLFTDNAAYREWCKQHINQRGDHMAAVIKRRNEHHRRERQVVTISVAFIVVAITMAHVFMDAKELFKQPHHDVRLMGLSFAWAMAFLGLVGSCFDAGYYIKRASNFRKELRAQEPQDKGWWHDRHWPAYNQRQILHVNRGIILFSVGWFGLLAALQLTFNIAGK